MSQIFNTLGSVSAQSLGTQKKTAFITFSGTSGGSLSKVLIAKAPVTGVSILQSVDYSLTKALDKSFLLSTFGDQPVTITLTGLSLYGSASADPKGSTSDQIVKFYQQNKISTDITKRVDVGIAGAGKTSQAFRCALVSLELTANQELSIADIGIYKLTMIGITL